MGGGPSLLNRQDIHVVIVGGGYGGVQLAKNLTNKANYTLIDPKEMMHHNLAALRAVTEAGFAPKTFIPYGPTFGNNFKQGAVTKINPSEQNVTLSNGENVGYSHLVIATGATGPFPGKLFGITSMSEALARSKHLLQQVQLAKKVVIVGGGAVGTELAAEIATDYKDKKVSLIHPRDKLVDPNTSDAFQNAVKEKVTKMGVTLLLGERVTNLDKLPKETVQETTVVTSKGSHIEADLVIPCTGLRVNSSAYKDSLPSSMDKKGALKVNGYFEVEGTKNIYAIGDCTNIPETKLAYNAGVHADLLAKNILAQETGGKPKEYKPASFFLLICLGRADGAGQWSTSLLPTFMATNIKSKGMFVSRYWGLMGQKVPTGK
ncbi:ferroptosis suppressor protein 1-like [Branchiostoma lanceolatum]|uniref:ferroptosis suppressor protein 1-like n=1 Tax=Branchiostoma lanceolatum TaxID=7740 RepID=UPI003455DAE8